MEMLSLVVIFVMTHFSLGVFLWLQARNLYAYPGLLGFPVVGNLFYFYKTLFLTSAESLRVYLNDVAEQHGKHGICFHYAFGNKMVALITSPDVVKQLGYHPKLKDKSHYGYQSFLHYMMGPFSWAPSDDCWKAMRKEYNCCLKKQMIETQYYSVFLKSADKLVELMLASGDSLAIDQTIMSIVQSVSLKTLLGVDDRWAFDPEVVNIFHLTKYLASLILGNPLIISIILYFVKPFDELLYRKKGTMRKAVLKEVDTNMMKYKQQLSSGDKESHCPLSISIATRLEKNDKRLTQELMEAYLTSTHTLTATLIGAITFYAVLPEMQEKAWKEQNDIFGDESREPTPQDLEQMKFLERFINETLRFCGPPFVEKQTSGDIEVDGITIPKDISVIYLLDLMRKDPKYWKNPKVFDPDRFLESNESLKYSFAPFGIGIRSCPGFNFAMTVMKITLSKIIRRTKLSTVDKNIKFEDLEFETVLLMGLKNPPLLEVKKI